MSKLKILRTAKGLPQTQVSRAIGIDNSRYHRIEKGDAKPTPAVARRLAEFFDHQITEMELLYPDDYATPEEPAAEAQKAG